MPTNFTQNQDKQREQASTASKQQDDARRQGQERSVASGGQKPFDNGRKSIESGEGQRQQKPSGNSTASGKQQGDRESRGEGGRMPGSANPASRPKQG